jgi:hypothetical protein
MISTLIVVICLVCLVTSNALSTTYLTPPAMINPKDYTTWTTSYSKSRMAKINAPFTNDQGEADTVHIYRLDLVGNQYERGFAHGAMMAKEIDFFVNVALPKYFISTIMDLDFSKYPEPIQKILNVVKIKGASVAPDALMKAMKWVYDSEFDSIPPYLIDEMNGIGDGVCNTLGSSCNAEEWRDTVKTVNMLPELIRMACTAFGAWDKASESGKLLQVRALDFGGGPFANFTMLNVYRSPDNSERPFASVTFPGMVGVITGVAKNGIGISEKVWDISGGDTPEGSYTGEPDVFMLRDLLQYSTSKEHASAHMQSVNRTWGIWAGIGDSNTQRMAITAYKQESAIEYTDKTMPSMTSQPYLEDLIYVDKHAQPSNYDPSQTNALYTPLSDFYGKISLDTARTVVQYHQTGDLHIAMYDFGSNEIIVSVGRTNSKGEYGPEGCDLSMWKAYNRPFLRWSFSDLWEGK